MHGALHWLEVTRNYLQLCKKHVGSTCAEVTHSRLLYHTLKASISQAQGFYITHLKLLKHTLKASKAHTQGFYITLLSMWCPK